MQLRVALDIKKPLFRGITMVKDASNLFLAVKYEKLHDFCYKCVMLTHVEKECI